MDNAMKVQLWEAPEDGRVFAVSMDISDFTALCYAGLNNDKAFFVNMLETIEACNEEIEANQAN